MADRLNPGDKVILEQGASIRLLYNAPPFIVAHADETALYLERILVDGENPWGNWPKQLVIPASPEGRSIGRSQASYVNTTNWSNGDTISRSHGVIHYSPEHGYIYTHSGQNATFSKNAPRLDSHEEQGKTAHQTMLGNQAKGPSHITIPLQPGTRIAFHNHLPPYTAQRGDQPGTLRLTCEKDDPRCPREILINRTGITLGRKHTNDYVMNHSEISKQQGTFEQDPDTGGYAFVSKGRAVPVLHAENAFLRHINRFTNQLSFSNPQMARRELVQLERLSRQIGNQFQQLLQVRELEASVLDANAEDVDGTYTEHALTGYSLWLESLGALYREGFTRTELASIQHMAGVLNTLAEDRSWLREVSQSFPTQGYRHDHRHLAPHTRQLSEYAHRKASQLEEEGELYLITGFVGHHVMARISKDPETGGYIYAEFNAGEGTTRLPKGPGNPEGNLVMGEKSHRLRPGASPEELIHLITERKLHDPFHDQQGYDECSRRIAASLKPEIHSYRAVKRQTRGNCTSRSTRHALENALGLDLMGRLTQYVADPEYSIGEDLRTALQARSEAVRLWMQDQNRFLSP